MTSFLKSIEAELTYQIRLQNELEVDTLEPVKYVIGTKQVKGKRYYIHLKTVDGKRVVDYLGDADSERLKVMARSSYKHELKKLVRHNIKVLQKALKEYRRFGREDVLAKLSPCLHDVMFDTDFDQDMKNLRKWMLEDYKKNPREFPKAKIYAKDGRRVRSKGECIIYNLLLDAGIPFRYDSVIELKRKNKFGDLETYYESPDFLIRCPDGKEIIIEHAGLLTSPQYAMDLANKLQAYQLNGYMLGHTLFVTNDTVDGGIDSQEINVIINCIKIHFPYL